MKSITLFSKNSNMLPAQSGPVGFLFECAKDSLAYRYYPQAICLKELMGDFGEKKAIAYKLARKLLANEPLHRNVQQFAIFEEIVIRELQLVHHILHLYEYLLRNKFTHCQFIGNSHFSRGLIWLSKNLASNLKVSFQKSLERDNRLKRIWRRLYEADFGRRSILHECRRALDFIDPYHKREQFIFRFKKKNWATCGIWFYTTARTFTNIGLFFEPYFPQTFQFLVENSLTGGEPLHGEGRVWFSLYEFSKKNMQPSSVELMMARKAIVSHLNSIFLSGSEGIARQLLLNSRFFQLFLSRHLPHGLYTSSIFEYWAESVRPVALVVGNAGFEGYALHVAKRYGIKTTLLQHGILGDFYQFMNSPVDYCIVRGMFWRNFLSSSLRSKAKILNPPSGIK